MNRARPAVISFGFTICFAIAAFGDSYPLDDTRGITPHGVEVSVVEYRGHAALRVVEREQAASEALVVVDATDFEDGVIEVELAGAPRSDAREGMRGFVGVAFRLEEGPSHRYECFYIRPTNGRAEEQIRRNHSTQYVSHPEYPWHRLRKESPGVYESYVDLEEGAWTKVKIEVDGTQAKLYVHGASQPALVVNDLKKGASRGAVALWIAEGTEGHFRNLKIVAK